MRSPVPVSRLTVMRTFAHLFSRRNDDNTRAPYLVHGWRWHHLSLLRDLRLVESALSDGHRICAADASGQGHRKSVTRAYKHVLQDNWAVHDDVESRLLYPWVQGRIGGARRAALSALSMRRRGLWRRREEVRIVLDNLAGDNCEGRTTQAASEVRALREAAAATFAASERVVVPAVRTLFDEQEQRAFNRTVLRSLSARQAQVALVVFRDALYDEHGRASADDRANFERQVPRAVRALVPVWRRTLCTSRLSFLAK